MVVFFHLSEDLRPAVAGWFPPALDALFRHFNLGVDIFFVLSGFVITYSVRKGLHTWAYLGRFGLRRSIRLDPPLWITILFEVGLIHLSLHFFPELGTATPTWPQILANVTYTQRFLGYAPIVPVFWSLTYEVQFYVVLVGALVLYRQVRTRRVVEANGGSSLPQYVFFSLFVYSLLIWAELLPLPVRGLFLDRWFEFSLGIAACSVFLGRTRVRALLALAAVTVIVTLLVRPNEYRILTVFVSVATALVLVGVGRKKAMDRVLSGPIMQFLGRISYSLYLVHLSVGWRFVSICKKLFGPKLGVLQGISALAGGVAISIFAAWLMYRLVEAPSMRVARRIRLSGGSSTSHGPSSATA